MAGFRQTKANICYRNPFQKARLSTTVGQTAPFPYLAYFFARHGSLARIVLAVVPITQN